MPRPATPSDQRLVTQQDVADTCGVTRVTVSLVLSGHPRISPATREKVLIAAQRLGYDPVAHESARRMGYRRLGRTQVNHVIGLLLPQGQLGVPYFLRMVDGIARVAEKIDYCLMIAQIPMPYHQAVQNALRPMIRGDVDGVITVGSPLTVEAVRELQRRLGFSGRPIVSMIRPSPGTAFVGTDDAPGVSQAIDALVGRGHREFLVLWTGASDTPFPPTAEYSARRIALAESIRHHGLSEARCLRFHKVPSHWMAPNLSRARLETPHGDVGDAEVIRLLRQHQGMTALLCDNDAVAINAMIALQRAGLKVPEQYAVVGFDDTDPFPGADGRNILSSIAVPLEEVGRVAGELLLERISDPTLNKGPVLLPTTFRARRSIGG